MTSFENIKRMAHLRQEKEDDLKKNKEKIIHLLFLLVIYYTVKPN